MATSQTRAASVGLLELEIHLFFFFGVHFSHSTIHCILMITFSFSLELNVLSHAYIYVYVCTQANTISFYLSAYMWLCMSADDLQITVFIADIFSHSNKRNKNKITVCILLGGRIIKIFNNRKSVGINFKIVNLKKKNK